MAPLSSVIFSMMDLHFGRVPSLITRDGLILIKGYTHVTTRPKFVTGESGELIFSERVESAGALVFFG
jgi:hypothetical protein